MTQISVDDQKLKKIADKLLTTLGDMPGEEADQIVLNVANLIYTDVLGLKGEVKKTKDMFACAGKHSQRIVEYTFIENE
jgi:hypothetical protein